MEPAIDVGEMITQDDGTVLEKGTTIVESTKEEVPYEELWADLPLDTGKNARVCIVLKTLDDNKDVRGMIIRIGGWCQGLVKTDDGMTVERYCPARSGEIMEGDTWDAHVKIGHTELPCKEVLDVEDFTEGHLKMKRGGISWKTVEFFTW